MSITVDNKLSVNSLLLFMEQCNEAIKNDILFGFYKPFKIFKSILKEASRIQEQSTFSSSAPITFTNNNIVVFSENNQGNYSEILQALVLNIKAFPNLQINYPPMSTPEEAEDMLPIAACAIIIGFLHSARIYTNAKEYFQNNLFIFQYFYLLFNAYGEISNPYIASTTLLHLLGSVVFPKNGSMNAGDILYAADDFFLLKGRLEGINQEIKLTQNIATQPEIHPKGYRKQIRKGIYVYNAEPIFSDSENPFPYLLWNREL